MEYLTYGQKSSLELDLKMSVSGSLVDINFETLRLFLGGSKFMAKELYLYLDRYIEKIEIIIKDKDTKELERLSISKKSLSCVGFNALETIVPYDKNVFDGYVMLQEYFSYQDKHLFVDIENMKDISNLSGDVLSASKNMSVKFHFSKGLSTAQLPSKNDFHLYCTPAINLFESDAVPIRKTEMQDEYLLSASELNKDQSEVFSVDNVRGWIPSKNTYQNYFSFESFSHMQDKGEYYSQAVKLNNSLHRTDTFLRFASSGGTFDDLEHNNATVSVKMTCTNKDVPSTLAIGDISVHDPLSQSDLNFSNITIPSISYPPPIGGDFLWKLISNMSLNYLSLDSIDTLKMILQTYDFFGASDFKQKARTDVILSGFKSISNKRIQMMYEGLPIRGIETELCLDPNMFTGIGEAYHLSCILNEFFALYCNVNSFHRLVVHIDNNETFAWAPKMGYKALV
ncbi:Protein ImpG/VasA [hydrothermal vent metagenome]|uniref:Protein ImpG/VasA n=1 Tax=hydrothermal vent metagenome TaxID=652676 RepID=A0A1W1BVA9_9ZZZZ